MWRTFKILLLLVITVTTMAYSGEIVGAPIIDINILRNLKLDNGDIPTLINLIAKEEGIDEQTLTETLQRESGLRQYDKGDVLISYTNDIGVGQINIATWQKTADRLGYDLRDPIDNLLMTAWIINNDSRGFENWVCYNKLN